MNKLVLHIYYGTAGNAGLYVKKIVDCTEKCNFDTGAIVNKYFVFGGDNYNKLFFRFSEKLKRNTIRRIVKFIELFIDYLLVLKTVKKLSKDYDEVIIDFSLNESYRLTYYFLKFLKKTKKVQLGITVHDVKPFYTNYSRIIIKDQDDILRLAKFFVVHNKLSERQLIHKFPKMKKYIFKYRFPLMDLNCLIKTSRCNFNNKNGIIFLFIGFLRKEKGIKILIDAWKKIQNDFNYITLTIAGAIPHNMNYNFNGLKNVVLKNEYLSDDEYIRYILEADYVILPYSEGTNSGILSTISSLGKPSITSDIDMFKESEFCINKLLFKTNNSDSLANILKKSVISYETNYLSLRDEVAKNVKEYNGKFEKEVIKEYEKILSVK